MITIFTSAIAGLGHLRVTDALIDGMPPSPYFLMGAKENRITYWHRLMSINPLLRLLMEWFQKGFQEKIFTVVYSRFLKYNPIHVYHDLIRIINKADSHEKTVLIIATHFGLAHQIAAVKEKVEKRSGKKLFLVVQVTDATFMRIWYVSGADIILVPSIEAAEEYRKYRDSLHETHPAQIEVLPYPLSVTLSKKLSTKEIIQKEESLKGTSEINIVLPISGAAVQLKYYLKLINHLSTSTLPFHFHIVARENVHTLIFLKQLEKYKNVSIYKSRRDKEVVDLYEKVYEDNVIAFEIVKPSEQSFKALIPFHKRGGAIILFTDPVGKQEHDNLQFLRMHHLLSDRSLFELVANWKNSKADARNTLKFNKAIELTNNPNVDALLITESFEIGLFSHLNQDLAPTSTDIGDNGTELFWKKMQDII